MRSDEIMVSGALTVSVVRVRGRTCTSGTRAGAVVGHASAGFPPGGMRRATTRRRCTERSRSTPSSRSRGADPAPQGAPGAGAGEEGGQRAAAQDHRHACDAVHQEFDVKPRGQAKERRPRRQGQLCGGSEYTFQWLALLSSKRYNNLFRPHGRVRVREAGLGGTEGVDPEGDVRAARV